uniref:SURP and G-patch domain-containing protein 2 n=1 Tax=Euleptes europaea TaxID=460621 RepID=UPI0025419E40|nr:SURP and G-patch domain-containing protein 2 [Euleptes europaea]
MASRRMTRESFDAFMQAKVKRYRLDRSDPIDEALHQLRVHSRPAPRTRYDDDFIDDSEGPRSDWQEDPREDFSLPSYRSSSPVTEEDDYYSKSYGQPLSRNRDYVHPTSRERDYGHSSSMDRDYEGPPSRDREYDRPATRKREYDPVPSRKTPRLHNTDYSSSELLSDFRPLGHLEEDYSAVRSQSNDLDYGFELEREFNLSLRGGRGRGKRGGLATRGMAKNKGVMGGPIKKWEPKRLPPTDDELADPSDRPKPRAMPSNRPHLYQRPQLAFLRGGLRPGYLASARGGEPNLDLAHPSDIFSTFGTEIIKWAGFHQIRKDEEYMELYRVLFSLETETCAKMLASFKCSLKPEHKDFCFSIVKPLQHAALKTPKVDNEFLNLLLERRVVATKNCFFQVIKPFDQYMMRLQDHLLKSVTPLLMACNAHELSVKASSLGDQGQAAASLETTISLCRKSLALLGQTFALASAFRQDKILEAIGVHESAPPPTLFPNFDTSALFGREYIEVLQNWMEKSGSPIVLKTPGPPAPNEREVVETRPKIKVLERADPKVVDTIEKLVNVVISGSLQGKDKTKFKSNPEYWFLLVEDSLEYKYYRLKLAEMQRLMAAPKEEPKEEKTPEERASESVRAMLYARKVASIKRRLFRRKRPGILQLAARARKARKSTVGTQTLLSAGTMLKHQRLRNQGSSSPAGAGPSFSDEADRPVCSGDTEEPLPAEEATAAGPCEEAPGPAHPLAGQFPDVDVKTMATAEKLAKFVAQVGPEIEQFSIDNSADNPDLWFLQDQESSAFKFYRTKVYELCPSINFNSVQESVDPSQSQEYLEGDGGAEEEEEDDDEEAELEEEAPPMETEAPQTEREGGEEAEETPAEEGASKTDELGTAEEGQASSSSEGAALQLVAQGAPSAPPQRKRISSKSLKVGMIPAQKRVCHVEEPQVHEPVRIAYDRPRGYTAYKRKKFPKTKDTEFLQKKLTGKNIGFQMLKKMGWQEGRGLGSHGDGIREPIKVGSTSAGEGLGVAGEEKKEDTFDTFRRRMINMYNLKRGCK